MPDVIDIKNQYLNILFKFNNNQKMTMYLVNYYNK